MGIYTSSDCTARRIAKNHREKSDSPYAQSVVFSDRIHRPISPIFEGIPMTTKVTTTGAAQAPSELKGDGHGTSGGDGQLVTLEDVGHTLKEGIVQSLSGLSTIETDIVALVRKTVSDTLRTGGTLAGDLVNVVHHVVMGTMGAVEQVGTGLTMSVKSVAKGIVMGVHDVNGDMVAAATETMRAIVKNASAVGSDVGVVARRAVDGVIEATAETGGNVAQVVKGAIEGAIEEAGKVSNMAVKAVKDVLGSVMGGLGETLSSKAHSGTHPTAHSESAAAKKTPASGKGRHGPSGEAMAH
jgi:hypothetical protein